MGEPCCAMCAMVGHRSCDLCGGPAWDADAEGNSQNRFDQPDGREFCFYCNADPARPGP